MSRAAVAVVAGIVAAAGLQAAEIAAPAAASRIAARVHAGAAIPATANPATANQGAGNVSTGSPAAAYLRIAAAGNARLETDFDRLQGPDRADPTASRADLRDIAFTEHLFDARLAALALPSGAQEHAHALIRANEARAALSAQAAAGTTPTRVASYRQRLAAANIPVEQAVRALRADLGLPAPATD